MAGTLMNAIIDNQVMKQFKEYNPDYDITQPGGRSIVPASSVNGGVVTLGVRPDLADTGDCYRILVDGNQYNAIVDGKGNFAYSLPDGRACTVASDYVTVLALLIPAGDSRAEAVHDDFTPERVGTDFYHVTCEDDGKTKNIIVFAFDNMVGFYSEEFPDLRHDEYIGPGLANSQFAHGSITKMVPAIPGGK